MVRRWPLLVAILVLAAVQIYAFHWGVITPDTVFQYRQALTGAYDDWHPPITTWIWRTLMRIAPGSAPYLLFDIALYWSAAAAIALHIGRRRGSGWAAVTVMVLAMPIAFGQLGAILKDPLLMATCLAASALILTRQESDTARLGLRGGIALVLIVAASAMRFNALFATLPLLIALVQRRATPKRLLATAMTGAIFLIFTSWLINVALLNPHRSDPIFSLVNFDLAGITEHGGGNVYPAMPDRPSEALTQGCYSVRLYNPIDSERCEQIEDRLHDYAHANHQGAIMIWAGAILQAPLPYLWHRAAHLNWNWRFLIPAAPADAVYMMSQPNDLGLHFTPNAVTKAVVAAAMAMAQSPLGRPISWIAIALGLLMIAHRLPSRRAITMLAGSSLLYGLAYAVVSVAPDMRYNVWTMLAAMIAMLIALSDLTVEKINIRTRTWLFAFAPACIVVLLETVWLVCALPPPL